MSAPLIAVIYDGIANSVFESQVLQPLIFEKQKEPQRIVWLISFESNVRADLPEQLIMSGIPYIRYKKIPFVGSISIRLAAYTLKKFLSRFDMYELRARGPIAGYICSYAYDTVRCNQFTIQARGLLAEEYAYTHKATNNRVKRFLHRVRYYQFYALESYVYGQALCAHERLTIEVVSAALGDYLTATYGTPYACIRIAQHDIPPLISVEQRTLWRAAMRIQMTIDQNVQVYCYNGSIKPWQFPEGVLTFFKEKYQESPQCVLVILTQDKVAFEHLLQLYALPAAAYRIYTVAHAQIYAYLCACDTGILLRENTIINWTSRPTKLLEYYAAGLEVVHNDTVAYAIRKE
jgi:hypothetical protein